MTTKMEQITPYLSDMEYTELIRWCIEDMKVDTPYPVQNVRQERMIKEVWDVLHIQDEFEFKFNDNYTEFKKFKI